MFQKMLTGAMIAGIAAGLLAAVLHFAFVQEYILLGERYEYGDLVHFQNAAEAQDHAHAATGHDHGDHGAADTTPGIWRDVLTVGFTVLIYMAYAALLTAGFGIAAQFGFAVGATQGALWGLGGFAAFQLAPAMGLAPELPGTIAADLTARQFWWWGTVAATGLGLIVLGYGRGLLAYGGGAVLLAAPHLIGAPALDEYFGYAPPEVGAAFSARVLGVGLVTWVFLGWIAGKEWTRGAGAS